MSEFNRQAHWQNVYEQKGENQVSWFQERPNISLELIEAVRADQSSAIIDIGGGASRLVDALVDKAYRDLTVLDLSESAVSIAKMRLGQRAATVNWIVADVTQWEPARSYDLWHDRAAFHFLTEASDRTAYIDRLTKACVPEGMRSSAPSLRTVRNAAAVCRSFATIPPSYRLHSRPNLLSSICAATTIKRPGAPFSIFSSACSGGCNRPDRCFG
jgi:2-polyprenyl-3-methyl-5-hydroxy-6-metoxy-1,4-benzoquinol methylase